MFDTGLGFADEKKQADFFITTLAQLVIFLGISAAWDRWYPRCRREKWAALEDQARAGQGTREPVESIEGTFLQPHS